MSDVRQLTPAACILVTLPYRSATVWSATKVVLYCRKSKCFPLYLCIYRTFANFAPMQYGDSKLKPITNLFPEMENAQENIEELQTMGIQNKDIRQLLIGKEIYYTGNLYDKDKRKSYQVKNVKIDISKSQNGITTIWLNNIHFKNFLKELWNTLQKTLDNGNWLHR